MWFLVLWLSFPSFRLHHTACGIQTLQCSALRAQSLNHWTAKDVPYNRAFKRQLYLDFPDGPVVKTPSFHCRGHKVRYLAGKLRSHKLHDVAKKI